MTITMAMPGMHGRRRRPPLHLDIDAVRLRGVHLLQLLQLLSPLLRTKTRKRRHRHHTGCGGAHRRNSAGHDGQTRRRQFKEVTIPTATATPRPVYMKVLAVLFVSSSPLILILSFTNYLSASAILKPWCSMVLFPHTTKEPLPRTSS